MNGTTVWSATASTGHAVRVVAARRGDLAWFEVEVNGSVTDTMGGAEAAVRRAESLVRQYEADARFLARRPR